MIVSKNKVVSLIYELRVNNQEGEIIETITKETPLVFLYGSGNLLPKFEENIDSLHVGDHFDFDLKIHEAYGEINYDAIVDVPISAFQINGSVDDKLLVVGSRIPMQDTSGNKLTGIVKDVKNDSVKMDFNHPLAGNALFFEGEITDIRNATDEELNHGHPHYEGGCNSCPECGCDDGHCGS